MVPNVFVEVDLMMELARHYDPTDKKIKSEKGDIILVVTKDKMVDVFGLNPNYTANFRRVDLYVEYEGRKFA